MNILGDRHLPVLMPGYRWSFTMSDAYDGIILRVVKKGQRYMGDFSYETENIVDERFIPVSPSADDAHIKNEILRYAQEMVEGWRPWATAGHRRIQGIMDEIIPPEDDKSTEPSYI